MESKNLQIINKILNEIAIINELTADMNFELFLSDEKTKRATCMTLINIGELVKNLSDEFRLANAEIPWKAISGLRDITAHRYQTLRMEDIWNTIQTDIPVLNEQLMKLTSG